MSAKVKSIPLMFLMFLITHLTFLISVLIVITHSSLLFIIIMSKTLCK